MNICVIAHQCYESGGLSVGLNMIEALAHVAADNKYLITIPENRGYENVCSKLPRHEVFVVGRGGLLTRWIQETFKIPKVIWAFKPNLIIALGDRGLANPPCMQAIYFHRPALVYPTEHYYRESFKNKLLFKYHAYFLRKCLPKTKLIICQTEIVKKRFCDKFNYAGEVLVSSPAPSTGLWGQKNESTTPEPIKPFSAYFKLLYLARFYPHKNHELILRCFQEFKTELRGVVAFITVENDQHPLATKLLNSIDRLGLSSKIISLGRIPHAEVPAYYKSCNGLLMPTLLETFGLPYIEAMSFKMPIITSDIDFARDICGKAAYYFDPWSPESMKDAILKVKNDAALRDSLITNGCNRLSEVSGSWEDTATETLRYFRNTMTM